MIIKNGRSFFYCPENMPKLQVQIVERKQAKIEAAALRVLTRQGFHGTSMRDIARAAGVSLGNIYNYYPTKEALFLRLVERQEAQVVAQRDQALEATGDLFEQESLLRFAREVRKIVYQNSDYWRLMYIDIVEFENRHFAHSFRRLSHHLASRLGGRLRVAEKKAGWNGVDPALAFTAIYLQFFTYFLVERLFGGKEHLGMPAEQAMKQIVFMVTKGLWRNPKRPPDVQKERKKS